MLHNQQLHLFPEQQKELTVNVEFAAFSLDVVTSAILKLAPPSSSVIVVTSLLNHIGTFVGLDKVIVAVSLFSSVICPQEQAR